LEWEATRNELQFQRNRLTQCSDQRTRRAIECRVEALMADLEDVQNGGDDEEKDSEQKESIRVEYRRSIKNYVFIQCSDQILAVLPSNPSFDFLSVARAPRGTLFCNSRKYGTFYITHSGTAIAQSPKYEHDAVHLVYRCGVRHKRWDHCFGMEPSPLFKAEHITKFEAIAYDEGFGVSGRLLVRCSMTNTAAFCQFFNGRELEILADALRKSRYYRMPGAVKEFHLTLFVFEMLYGADLVDLVLERYQRSLELKSSIAKPSIDGAGDNKEDGDGMGVDGDVPMLRGPGVSESETEAEVAMIDEAGNLEAGKSEITEEEGH